jgi:hypothetical protein
MLKLGRVKIALSTEGALISFILPLLKPLSRKQKKNTRTQNRAAD